MNKDVIINGIKLDDMEQELVLILARYYPITFLDAGMVFVNVNKQFDWAKISIETAFALGRSPIEFSGMIGGGRCNEIIKSHKEASP